MQKAEIVGLNNAQRPLSKIDHRLGHKITLRNLRRSKTYGTVSDHRAIKLVINNSNSSDIWKLNKILLNNPWDSPGWCGSVD